MFAISFEEYIEKVKENLCCNMSDDERKVLVCYEYTDKNIDDNLDYFKDCYNRELSAYKSLLWFNDYLKDKEKIIKKFSKFVERVRKQNLKQI